MYHKIPICDTFPNFKTPQNPNNQTHNTNNKNPIRITKWEFKYSHF